MTRAPVVGSLAGLALAVLCATPVHAQEGLAERAAAAQASGDASTAADLYTELVREEPGDIQWVLKAADALLTAHRFNDALDLLDEESERHATSAEVPIRIALAHKLKAEDLRARGSVEINVRFQLEEAARVAEDVLRQFPWERRPRLILAQCKAELGEEAEALAQAEEIVRRDPNDQAGHVLLGDAHYREFIRLKGILADRGPTGKELTTTLELVDAARKGAFDCYSRAADLDENRAFPRVQLGNIYAWTGNVEQSLVQYGKALAIDPDAGVDHTWIGQQVDETRRTEFYRDAAAAYRARPGASDARCATLDWYHAYALFERKKYPEAYALFDRVVTANDQLLNSHCYAMICAYWAGEAADAEEQAIRYGEAASSHFADTIRARDDQAQIVSILEFLARRTHEGDRKERSRTLNLVLAKVLDTERHWNNYAFLCRETGAYEDSLNGYENALSIAPNSPQVLNDAAVILQYHLATPENLDRAERYYRRAIDEAEIVLANENSKPGERERAAQAKRDAKGNLKAMRKQREEAEKKQREGSRGKKADS